MRIVVIGDTKLIRSKVVKDLRPGDHAVLAASPPSGVKTMTGEGLKEALTGVNAHLGTVTFDVAQEDAHRAKSGKHPRGVR
ncbi:hypothetical protein [Paraburkholderia bryophila]|uniref:Uncharacterized protein n=1 Tax=Paraburkholderia bryophila TaxID=420952 RepID=A0A7Y9W4P6_9BURK|nr:hypothetical protein [Paraburkholderia bryophila]